MSAGRDRPGAATIVRPPADAYRAGVGEVGFTLGEFWPDAFKENEVGLFIFDRTG